MILFELCGEREDHQAYQSMVVANGNRHYDFLRSAVDAALAVDRPLLSQTVLKAINFHALACLHSYAGEYRPCEVIVGTFRPPEHYRVGTLMDDFVNYVNRYWEVYDAVTLSAYVLWRLNHIHPFINGNGRTARAACHFVLCLKYNTWLPGETTVPELLRSPDFNPEYIDALHQADDAFKSGSTNYLDPVILLLNRVLRRQIQSIAGGD